MSASATSNTDFQAHETPPFFFTTKAYEQEALRALLEEVNQVAKDLTLPEQLPITSSNLVEVFIAPPASGMVGTASSSNYHYFVRAGRKFAGLNRRNLNAVWEQDRKNYLWPVSRIDTNAAFAIATQIMAKAGINIVALNSECNVQLDVTRPNGPRSLVFVPDYWIDWRKNGKSLAFLVFLAPTKDIRMLRVDDPTYVLRKAVEVRNLGELLREGGAPRILLERMGLELTNPPANGANQLDAR
jgi:hypothetical protein